MADEKPVKPDPDPTDLTTQALRREIELLREEIKLRWALGDKLLDEKMAHVSEKFEMLERYRQEAKDDSRKEVEAALTAQKESVREQTLASDRAINKSEDAINKQLGDLKTSFHQEITNLRRDLDETKKRITSVE